MSFVKRILPLVCLILTLLMTTACGVTIHEGLGHGDAVDKSSGTVWYHASTCYEAVELEKKLGKLVVGEHSLELYKLPDMDPSKWVATEDKNVLYAEGVTLPTLTEMAPETMIIYLDAATEQKLKTLSKPETLSAIVKAYTEGGSVLYPAKTPSATYRVRFTSDAYPGLYYVLTYVEYATDYIVEDNNYGKYFLYDRFDQKFVPVGSEIHMALGLGESVTEASTESVTE